MKDTKQDETCPRTKLAAKNKKKKKTQTKKTLAGESRSARRRFTHFHIQPAAAGNSEDSLVTHRSCGAGRCGPRSVYTQDYREPKTVPGGQRYKSRPHHHVSCWPTSSGVVVQRLHFPPPRNRREEARRDRKQDRKPQPKRNLGEPSPQGDPGGVSVGPSPDRSKPTDQPPTNPRPQTTQARGRARQSRERGSSHGQAVDGNKPDASGAQTMRAAY